MGNRKRYQTAVDLVNEAQAQVWIERHFKVAARKMPDQYRLDFSLFHDPVNGKHLEGTLWAVAEYKNRADISTDTYKTIILSVSKYCAGMNWVRHLGCKFLLIVEFSNGLYAVDVPMLPKASVMWGGRNDRDDWQDEEPVIHIPVASFKRMIKFEQV